MSGTAEGARGSRLRVVDSGMSAIDRSADRPVFKQIADELHEQIATGVIAQGERIPSETQLMDR